MRLDRPLCLAALLCLLPWAEPQQAGAQQPDSYVFADHYDKREELVPMRDGVKLFTIIYTPKDAAPGKTYPILVNRTAYGQPPYGPGKFRRWGGPYVEFSKRGYIFVYQDVRGRGMSEGEFIYQVPFIRATRPRTPAPTCTTP